MLYYGFSHCALHTWPPLARGDKVSRVQCACTRGSCAWRASLTIWGIICWPLIGQNRKYCPLIGQNRDTALWLVNPLYCELGQCFLTKNWLQASWSLWPLRVLLKSSSRCLNKVCKTENIQGCYVGERSSAQRYRNDILLRSFCAINCCCGGWCGVVMSFSGKARPRRAKLPSLTTIILDLLELS